MNNINNGLLISLLVLVGIPAAVIAVYLLVRAAGYGWYKGRFAAEEREERNREEQRTDQINRNGRYRKEETSDEC